MDAIRAMASLVVVAGHAQMLFFGSRKGGQSAPGAPHTTAASVQPKTMGLGHQAVIVFFVLSGFLVGNSVWKMVRLNRWSWRRYLIQRMTRLWIVLIPALIIGGCLDRTGVSLLSGHHSIYSAPGGQDMVHLDLLSKLSIKTLTGNTLYLQTILVPTYGTNAALWSLANEFWYYLIFPLLLLAVASKGSLGARVSYGVLGIALLAVVGPKISVLFPIWLFGFFVSLLRLKIPAHMRVAATIGCLLQFLAVNAVVKMRPMPALAADLLLGISFALFLFSILHARQPIRSMLYQRLATLFSKFSYTLYLVHLPFLTFLTGIIIVPWHGWRKDPAHLLASVMLIVLAYGYAWFLYLLFERNTDRLRNWITNHHLLATAK